MEISTLVDSVTLTDARSTIKHFPSLKESVLKHKPVLRQIIEKHGHQYLDQYARRYQRLSVNEATANRQKKLLNIFNRYVAERLNQRIADQATEQLKSSYFVSTTDHHGPLIHPFFVNGNLISAASHLTNNPTGPNSVIVFSCANVSLNNSSFPRGLLFHRWEKGTAQMERLSFFPAADRLCPVYGLRPYVASDIQRLIKQVNDLSQNQKLSPQAAEIINQLLTTVIGSEWALDSKNFTDQITKINFELWRRFFSQNGLDSMNLIYIDQEGLVNELLLAYHLQTETLIHQIIFNKEIRNLWASYFDGIQGSFDTKKQIGTYLFWAIPPQEKYRQQLWLKGNTLTTQDGSYSLPLTPTAVQEAIKRKEIMPGMALTFTILAFYYGLKCLGGFSQVNYLTAMKQSFQQLACDLTDTESQNICQDVITNELCGEVTLAFIEGQNHDIHPATFIDLLTYGHNKTWEKLVELMKTIKLDEALNPLIPELYRIVYPENERQPQLAAITAEHITQATGLAQKIQPCAFLR